MSNSNRVFYFLASVLLLIGLKTSLAFEIPPRPDPPRLVNDFARMMSPDEVQHLEDKLVSYSDSTSTQIAIVTVESLDGDDIASTAFKIGDSWGVGGKNQDNGIVILVSDQDRAVFIATGKGMEGPVPDITANRIMENIIVPNFKNGNYYQGLDEATTAIIKSASGEFVAELGDKKDDSGIPIIILILVILFIIWILSRIRRRGSGYMSRGGTYIPPWYWGGGSGGFGGGGFGGGGGGGFGGFGGGSFGGGGAGGKW